jgi:ComF family protein
VIQASAGRALAVRAARRFRDLGAGVAEFMLPQRCPGCGAPADARRLLCDSCRAAIPLVSFPICARCLAFEREPAGCTRHAGFQVWPAWLHDAIAAAAVQAFKFGARTALASELALEMVRAIPPAGFDLVMAVPLHRVRRRERGYDQAALLAEAVGAALGVPRLADGLRRERPTRPQTSLDAAGRRRNLRGAFRVMRASELKGRRVLLVDDVITTGATFEAALSALEDAGARASGAALSWAQ